MYNLQEKIKENYELSKKLKKENDELYTDIVCYIRTSVLEDMEQEEVIQDILEMFLRNQEHGKDIRQVIGDNPKEFCDNVIKAVNPKKITKSKIKSGFDVMINSFMILITINIFFDYIPKAIKLGKVIDYEMNLVFIIESIALIALAIGMVYYICKNSFYLSKRSKVHRFILLWLIGVGMIGIPVLAHFIVYKPYKVYIDKLSIGISIYIVVPILLIYWIWSVLNKRFLFR